METLRMPSMAKKETQPIQREPEIKSSQKEEELSKSIDRGKIELLKNNVDSIIDKINQLTPEKINPYWIFNNCSKEHEFIKKNFRTIDDKINWQLLVDLLPEEQREKWDYEKKRVWTEGLAIGTLVNLLRTKNPASFNPLWIRNNDYGLYRHLRRKLRNEQTGEIAWNLFVEKLPEELMEKWVTGMREEKKKEFIENKIKFTFESAIERLTDLLEQNKPASCSSSDINTWDPSLHSYFRRYVNKKGGGIDWEKIMEKIDPNLREKFIYPKKFEEEYPTENYENEDEVETLINNNKESLLTFFVASSPEERSKRNDICLKMIKLAKKGNLIAEERLMDYLEIIESEWIEKKKVLEIYKFRTDILKERTRRCIYLYRENGTANFVWYLLVNLKKHALELNAKHNRIYLDDPAFANSKEKRLDRINFEELYN